MRNGKMLSPQNNEITIETADDVTLVERVIARLKQVYDPEIPVNIYDLGLIYNVEVNDENIAFITMTLTTPNCPVAGSLPGEVECAAREVDNIKNAHVELVWDPPWSQENMSDVARLELGYL